LLRRDAQVSSGVRPCSSVAAVIVLLAPILNIPRGESNTMETPKLLTVQITNQVYNVLPATYPHASHLQQPGQHLEQSSKIPSSRMRVGQHVAGAPTPEPDQRVPWHRPLLATPPCTSIWTTARFFLCVIPCFATSEHTERSTTASSERSASCRVCKLSCSMKESFLRPVVASHFRHRRQPRVQ
jgi:hypothetical protein